MKKLILLSSLLFLICSCEGSNYIVKNCIDSQSSTYFSSKYGYFKGTRNYQIKIKENKEVKVEVTSKEGTLNIEVYDKNTSYYEGNIDKDFSFTINLEKGNYNVSIKTVKHSGGYKFSW